MTLGSRMGLSKKDIDNIIELYNSGVLPKKIEEQYELKTGTITYLRKKMNIPRYIAHKYSDEIVSKAVKELTSGVLLKDIMNKHEIGESVLKRYMNSNNIKYKSDHGRKRKFNKFYFDNIDTNNKAYWLGFIYADGCIYKTDKTQTRANRLSINISSKDKELLISFLKDIESENVEILETIPKGSYSKNPMSRIHLNSVELCDSLQKLGVYQNKTNNISFPGKYQLNEKYYSHFIRGFFDGDGCISSGIFSIIGSKDILISLQKILMRKCDLNKTKLCGYPHKNIEVYDLKYGGRKQINRIFDYLYKDANIFLHRKHKKFNLSL